MFDYVWLGSAPADEHCAQVGTDDYSDRAWQECRAYKNQIKRIAREAGKEIPQGASVIIKTENHDFGSYYEVVVKYDDNDAKAVEFAYWAEEHIPGKWDDAARIELTGADVVAP